MFLKKSYFKFFALRHKDIKQVAAITHLVVPSIERGYGGRSINGLTGAIPGNFPPDTTLKTTRFILMMTMIGRQYRAVFIWLLIFPWCGFFLSSASALPMNEALDRAVVNLGAGIFSQDIFKSISIRIQNRSSDSAKHINREIEVALFLSFLRKYRRTRLHKTAARNSDIAVLGYWEKKGNLLYLQLEASFKRRNDVVSSSTTVAFEYEEGDKRVQIAVLSIKSAFLSTESKKRFTAVYRQALWQQKVYLLARSSDIEAFDLDKLSLSTGCTGNDCLEIAGMRLGVGRIVSISLFRLNQTEFLVSSKMINISDGSTIYQAKVRHMGRLGFLSQTLEKTAMQMAQKEKQYAKLKSSGL